jgi:glycosyltransferase involved in cell wall biosynthesis
MNDLRVVIPAYNEEHGLGLTIDRLRKACPEAEVLVVNDGSRDGTVQVAENKGVLLINFAANRGYGRALKAGFAHESGRGINYMAFLDADTTYPPEYLPRMYALAKEQGVDLVIGSRLQGTNSEMKYLRRVGNTFFAYLVFLYTHRFVSDTASGLRLFRASLVRGFEDLPNGLEFTPAMTTSVLQSGKSVLEIPIEYSERIGESKLHILRDGFRFFKAIRNEARKGKPSTFFEFIGIPLFVAAFLLGINSISRSLGGPLLGLKRHSNRRE